jgi:predicted Ser/Thr protein kinase
VAEDKPRNERKKPEIGDKAETPDSATRRFEPLEATRLAPAKERKETDDSERSSPGGEGGERQDSTEALGETELIDHSGDTPDATEVIGNKPLDQGDTDRTELLGASGGKDGTPPPDRTRRIDSLTDPGDLGATEVCDSGDALDVTRPANVDIKSAPLPGDATRGGGESGGLSLTVGSVLRNRFRITGVLGEGGMGAVFSAVDMLKEEARDENVDVALKVMKADIVDATMSFMGLQREARRAQALAHPNIVTVYDFDRADGVIYMTMEYLRGKPLDAMLEKQPHGLDLVDARDITTQICKGLDYAHREGIVHADLKPQNVFVLDSGRAKILDFGIARAYQAKKQDVVESVFSGYSPAFASPEVMARKSPSPTDDIYALGCVVYLMFTGRHPFDWTPANKAQEQGLKPKRDASFRRAEWAAVSAALDFDASRRPQDAAAFLKRFAPSRVRQVALTVSLASMIVAAASMYFYEPVAGPDTPFEELPMALQQQISRNLEDAGAFRSFGDLDSAFQLYDAVLIAHPGNLEATEGINQASIEVITMVRDAIRSGRITPAVGRQTLTALLEYETLPSRSRRQISQALDDL